MASFLLDTAAFLWLALDPDKLSPPVRTICTDARNQLLLSAVSVWEMEMKYRLGKLSLILPPPQFVRTYRQAHLIDALPFSEAAALQYGNLPDVHRDPFDRMLVCQAMESGLILT